MPIKLKKSQTVIVRGTSKKVTTHYYMRSTPIAELQKEYEGCFSTDIQGATITKRGKGKLKAKIQNELVRRKVL
jgi:hypothetical protein|tara:strand:- start:193 stop:414 length:222 start_codon:yes stop_codon:yes gene_type:complete